VTETLTLSLIAHTNVGKTALARTLLRRDVGEVRDQPHVTLTPEEHVLVEGRHEGRDVRLVLWDTPGFGDTARLLKRLRGEKDPVGRFLRETWDRWVDRPFWCSQQAVRNVRDHADVVLYLVNAAEAPEAAAYVGLELELLAWMGRPIVVCLNQTGPAASAAEAAALEERWRVRLSSAPAVEGVISLDAFTRCWVEEGRLFECMTSALAPERRAAMRVLHRAWNARNRGVFEESMRQVSAFLAEAATDREKFDKGLLGKVGGARDKAARRLEDRLDAGRRNLMNDLIRLHDLAGSSTAEIARNAENLQAYGDPVVPADKSTLWGAVVGGALLGIKADLAAGGLTFGGGAVLGAIVGALLGRGLAEGVELVSGAAEPAVGWTPEFLTGLLRLSLLDYVAVAHFGRGRGAFQEGLAPQQWVQSITDAVARGAPTLHRVWKAAGSKERAETARALIPCVVAAGVATLRSRYPGSTAFLEETGPEASGDAAASP
jgi:hypothetical protein